MKLIIAINLIHWLMHINAHTHTRTHTHTHAQSENTPFEQKINLEQKAALQSHECFGIGRLATCVDKRRKRGLRNPLLNVLKSI